MNTHPKLKNILTLLLLLFLPLLADEPVEETPEVEEEVVFFHSHIPFPEDNYLGLWHFRLELASLEGSDFQASITGHDVAGDAVFQQETTALGGSALLSWESVGKTVRTLQSLEVVSDQELAGVLWMWDDHLGLMNGVSLTNEISTDLVMPYLPSDYFTWKTSFAVKGLSESNLTGDLGFGYYDESRIYEEKEIWQGLNDRGHFLRSPFYNIRIGELGDEPDVRWSRVRSLYPDFQITGFQSLLTRDFSDFEKTRGCAIELKSEGSAQGWVGFSTQKGLPFRDSFVFTNANAEPVQVSFSLQHRVEVLPDETELEVEGEEQPIQYQILVSNASMVLLPHESNTPSLDTLFPEFEGVAVSMKYDATTIPEVDVEGEEPVLPEARGIFALHMQNNRTDTSLGGHYFAPRDSRRGVAWMNMANLYDTHIEAYNTTDRYQKFDVAISNGAGAVVYQYSQEVAPWEQLSGLSSSSVRAAITALNEALEPEEQLVFDGVLRVDISLESIGTFFSKVTAFQERDFAIVNGAMLPPEPEPEPEPEVEAPVEGDPGDEPTP